MESFVPVQLSGPEVSFYLVCLIKSFLNKYLQQDSTSLFLSLVKMLTLVLYSVCVIQKKAAQEI